jgi:hypothetical protein
MLPFDEFGPRPAIRLQSFRQLVMSRKVRSTNFSLDRIRKRPKARQNLWLAPRASNQQ